MSSQKIKIIDGVLVLVAFAIGIGFFFLLKPTPEIPTPVEPVVEVPEAPVVPTGATPVIIGKSVEGREIKELTYGTGDTHLLFVGGVHGGYEWNSVLLAYQFIDYLEANPGVVPSNMSITIIPSLNPDGVAKIIGKEGRFALADVPLTVDSAPGRFNANGVDLNRNFDCKWQPQSTWRGKVVSAGTAAFSEPEAATLRDFVAKIKPVGVVFWHSQANAVYASECKTGILPGTRDIMNAYSKASTYPAVDTFDAYPVTGDAEGWLASIGIPAITVELATHETVEWERNLAGFQALLAHYVATPSTTTP